MADPEERFGDSVLRFFDPDGLELELCTDVSASPKAGWDVDDIPATAAIRGLHGVTVREADAAATGRFLTADLGFALAEETTERRRYRLEGGGPGRTIDVVPEPTDSHGSIAAGSIHHVAWRVPDVAAQQAARMALIGRGHLVSPIMDRQYFQSVYFREPGGVLFEIATDPPGFMVDEAPEALGSSLQLPPWLEAERDSIVARLPALDEARPTVPVEV
jgi:glyoxalase family protein